MKQCSYPEGIDTEDCEQQVASVQLSNN